MSSGLEFRGVSKSFGAVRALDDVSFAVAAGETHACVGENGAGKSTLLKILAGIVAPDRGEIRWQDARLRLTGPRDALERGIGLVSQETLAFPNLSVSGNIFAGRERTHRGGRLDEPAMRARTAALLADLHVPVSPDTGMDRLPAAYAQLVQVARALAFDCRVLVLDEPTTSLTDAEVDHLFGVLGRLKAQGVTVLFVSHRLPEVFRLCDRITVLRDGRVVTTVARAETSPDAIVRAMVGREPPARLAGSGEDTRGRSLLAVRDFTRRPAFEYVSFDVHAGEVVGLFGLVGSGRSELLETIFGLHPRHAGTMAIDGHPISPSSPAEAARAGLALVPEDRQRQGLFANLSVRHNLALPRAAQRRLLTIHDRDERQLAQHAVDALSIRTSSLEAAPDQLSGGNQQKVVTGKWLATEPRVLLLDEPTKGVDVGAKFEIHAIIRQQVRDGMGCLMASSDLPEVLAIADRILVMRQGGLRGEITGAMATEENVMRLAAHEARFSGGSVPAGPPSGGHA
jgi:rhamnose transport system ATP-binding protein